MLLQISNHIAFVNGQASSIDVTTIITWHHLARFELIQALKHLQRSGAD